MSSFKFIFSWEQIGSLEGLQHVETDQSPSILKVERDLIHKTVGAANMLEQI